MDTQATINIAIDRLLIRDGRSFYWLSKQTGISYTTLWRLKKGKALGINFATLIKLCEVLKCTPGDLITITKKEPRHKDIVIRGAAARSKLDQ
jgi:putative transcriptional regulator